MASRRPNYKKRWAKMLFAVGALTTAAIVLRLPIARNLERLGVNALEQGEAKRAASRLRFSLWLHHGTPETWISLGTAYHVLGHEDDAVAAFRQAQRRDPTLADAYIAEARCLCSAGRYEDARRAFEKAHQADPGLPEPIEGLVDIAVRQERHGDALAWIALEVCPDPESGECPAMAQAELARRLGDLGKTGEAAERLLEAVDMNPDDPALLYDTGYYLNVAGRHDEAAAILARAVEANPDDISSLCELAWARLMTADLEGAQRLYEEALQVDALHQACLWGYSVFLERRGRSADAASILERLLQTSDLDPDVRDAALERLSGLGDAGPGGTTGSPW